MDQRVIKYYNGELDSQECRDLLEEAFSNHELKMQLMDYENTQALMHIHSLNANEEEGEQHYSQFMAEIRKRKRIKQMAIRVAVAASIIACMVMTWKISASVAQSDMLSINAVRQVLSVPNGQRAHIVLPDGSKVWVNAGSVITYPSVFVGQRNVTLRGEAFFEVRKDKKPFIVSTPKGNVRVYGTCFNVFSYPEELFSVSLIRGSVKVYKFDMANHAIMLSPGQRFVKYANGYEIRGVEDEPLMWKEGLYAFNGQKFKDVARRLGVYYNVKIAIMKPSLGNYVYTGKFRQNDGVMEVLRVIQKIHHFNIKKIENKNEIILY